ncbi:kinase-like domain-containing protein [Glomus cerebriforme]|uniref:Kinase-like domain-containing protein n=1 Tax=Glomus cerebriforme TaxID=658196 RepID=A0A397TP86_9GLOM|nr:kinase-like domain-containing protein [Glomus cerebriforme]
MEQEYLSDDVIEQIKDFYHSIDADYGLTEEQKLLIDKLIINEELKERYKKYGLCKECKQPNIHYRWCQSSAKHFQQKFQNWSSGNSEVDKIIQESQLNAKDYWEKLEWIEYDNFEHIEYITKGGFGSIYKAKWRHRIVALKSLNNSKNITLDFLNEINLHLKMNNSRYTIYIYGITKDPKTSNFMMIMEYAENGNLRQRLNSDFNSLNWNDKLDILQNIAKGLDDIHKKGLTHRDFHSGNILLSKDFVFRIYYLITDLGLSKPANEKSENFGIIIYEVINGLPPYHDMAHEEFLAIKICNGLRPSFNIKVPQLVVDIFKQCVDADLSKRPTAKYLLEIFNQWWNEIDDEDSEIYKQSVEADEINKKQASITKLDNSKLTYTTHHQAIYTSRLLNFNNLPEPKNAESEEEYSKNVDECINHQKELLPDNFQQLSESDCKSSLSFQEVRKLLMDRISTEHPLSDPPQVGHDNVLGSLPDNSPHLPQLWDIENRLQ